MNPLRIFVSHSHRDNEYCRELVRSLRTGGADVWYDETDLPEGLLMEKIAQELPSRPVFVVVLSKAALHESKWVPVECGQAITNKVHDPSRQIIPVSAESVQDETFTGIMSLLEGYKRLEGPNGQPLPPPEAALRILAIANHEKLPLPSSAEGTAQQLFTLGLQFRDQQDYDRAIAMFQRATDSAHDPQFFEAWHELAKMQLYLHRYEDALQSIDHALAIRVDDEGALQTKIDILRAAPDPQGQQTALLRQLVELHTSIHDLAQYRLGSGTPPYSKQRTAWFSQLEIWLAFGRAKDILASDVPDSELIMAIFSDGTDPRAKIQNYVRLFKLKSAALLQLARKSEAAQAQKAAELLLRVCNNKHSRQELPTFQQAIALSPKDAKYLWSEYLKMLASYRNYALFAKLIEQAPLSSAEKAACWRAMSVKIHRGLGLTSEIWLDSRVWWLFTRFIYYFAFFMLCSFVGAISSAIAFSVFDWVKPYSDIADTPSYAFGYFIGGLSFILFIIRFEKSRLRVKYAKTQVDKLVASEKVISA